MVGKNHIIFELSSSKKGNQLETLNLELVLSGYPTKLTED